MAKIDKFFEVLLERSGSDLHLAEGEAPKIRLHGHIEPLDGPTPLSASEIKAYMEEICEPLRWRRFLDTGDLDFAYALHDDARFRANYYRHVNGLGCVFRLIPNEIKSLEELGLPPILKSFTELHSGLVLITGPTGSGKSTTLAAIIDRINSHQCKHILTIEEPIEFVHPSKKSVIVQREVGIDCGSFPAALRSVSRQDVDVIMVGEMRDLETIHLALSSAERGMMVFGTLHTNSAAKTIDRIVDVFPVKQKLAVRTMLAASLRGICSQVLCRRADGRGRCCATEILIGTPALANVIREGTVAKIRNIMQSGKSMGMRLMDDCLHELLEAGETSGREAYMKAFDKGRFSGVKEKV